MAGIQFIPYSIVRHQNRTRSQNRTAGKRRAKHLGSSEVTKRNRSAQEREKPQNSVLEFSPFKSALRDFRERRKACNIHKHRARARGHERQSQEAQEHKSIVSSGVSEFCSFLKTRSMFVNRGHCKWCEASEEYKRQARLSLGRSESLRTTLKSSETFWSHFAHLHKTSHMLVA